MIELTIPGRGKVQISHLVLDVNGTIAVDGNLIPGIREKILAIRDRLEVSLITADTHSKQGRIDTYLGVKAHIIEKNDEIQQKVEFIRQLGAENVIAIGQGANDAGMLEKAGIGICVLSAEGASPKTIMAADIVVPDIQTAFELIENPLRMIATLRQ